MSATRQSKHFTKKLFLLRVSLGFVMLWSFFDKLLGLGFATTAERAWLNGGSPTTGFLGNAVHGPFAEFYNGLAGNVLVDWLFMLGLLGVGIGLLFGVAVRFSGYIGALMMFLMYSALLPPANNPFIDDHIVYGLLFLLLAHSDVGSTFGLQSWWRKTSVVKSLPFLA